MRILVAEPVDFCDAARDILAAVGSVELRSVPPSNLAPAFSEYDVVWIRLRHRVTAEVLGPRPRCRILAVPATGIDHVDVEACAARNVRVISLKGQTHLLRDVRATAELTIGLILALVRHIPSAALSVIRGEWDRDAFRGNELFGKTAGVVGLGRLGSIVARYLAAFDVRVLGCDPNLDAVAEHVSERVDLPTLLTESDIVTLHVGYDKSTHQLIGERQLALMKPGAVLVNTSRGGIVDEAALLSALESGQLAGAALDVLDGEPDVEGHPLVRAARERSDMIVVPHMGGSTFESLAKAETLLARQVAEALAGRP